MILPIQAIADIDNALKLRYHQQILRRHTFPNGLRVVHHQKKKNMPAAVQSGACHVVDTSIGSEESRGVLLVPFVWHLGAHI